MVRMHKRLFDARHISFFDKFFGCIYTMTELNASDTFIRDMTDVLAYPWGMRERLRQSPNSQSVASILDERLAPLRILYMPEETESVTEPIEYPSTVTVPNVEPIPISREPATSPDAKPPLPYVADGKLVGQRHYGDYCINPNKSQEIKVVAPDVAPDAEQDVVPEVAPEAAGSCTIL